MTTLKRTFPLLLVVVGCGGTGDRTVFEAAGMGDLGRVRALISRDTMAVGSRDEKRNTPLHVAARVLVLDGAPS